MVAYVVVVKERTLDPAQEAIYASKGRAASAGHPITVRALRTKYELLEGPPIETVSILEFPSFDEARAWYYSPAYQEALPHRLKGGDYRAIIVDGV
jgi:uncharacterized protein (DUF1330 family)